jgi:hypothetical protein
MGEAITSPQESTASRYSGLVVLPAESVDSAGGIYEALLAGVEGMASGADVHCERLAGRARLELGTARAVHRDDVVFGVDSLLHRFIPTAIG